MSWKIDYEGESPIKKDFNSPIYVIAEETIDQIKSSIWSSDEGVLYLVPRETNKIHHGKYINPFQLEAYQHIRSKFGVGNMVSYANIKALFPEMGMFKLSYWLTYLWLHGYLEKYAKGKHGRFWRGPKQPKFKARGKYYGVHYEILDKK